MQKLVAHEVCLKKKLPEKPAIKKLTSSDSEANFPGSLFPESSIPLSDKPSKFPRSQSQLPQKTTSWEFEVSFSRRRVSENPAFQKDRFLRNQSHLLQKAVSWEIKVCFLWCLTGHISNLRSQLSQTFPLTSPDDLFLRRWNTKDNHFSKTLLRNEPASWCFLPKKLTSGSPEYSFPSWKASF